LMPTIGFCQMRSEAGWRSFNAHPECAFVYGHLRLIAADGSHLLTPNQPCVEKDHCLELLRRDYIWTPGVVMYRRDAFASVLGFDTLIDACADCDLNIRIARDWPAYCHGELILEYRKHGGNMSKNPALMLKTALAANRLQLNYVKGQQATRGSCQGGQEGRARVFRSAGACESALPRRFSRVEVRDERHMDAFAIRSCGAS
jgi:hypothetical protein